MNFPDAWYDMPSLVMARCARAALRLLSGALALSMLATTANAQCASWMPGEGVPGVVGSATIVTTWDADGQGPAPPKAVVAGTLIMAGNVQADSVATYDPATGAWASLGLGAQSTVRAVGTMSTGDLVVAGELWNTAGYPILGIARWDGSAWSALGPIGRRAWALVTMPNGDLVAAGNFPGGIARWDGNAWQPLGSGLIAPIGYREVNALAVMPNGDLIAGGNFHTAGGISAQFIARWDGAAWSSLGSWVTGRVYSLTTLPNGDLVAAGSISLACLVGRWDGTTWSSLGAGMSHPSGPFGSQPSSIVLALETLPNGDLVAAGDFVHADGVSANNIARWDGSSWTPLGAGTDDCVSALAALPNGDLIASGEFSSAGGVGVRRVAKWDGGTWSSLGSGFDDQVDSLITLPNGDLIAGGQFTTAGSGNAQNLARWDGATWAPLAGGSHPGNGAVRALTTQSNGDVIAGGDFGYVSRWDGAAWSSLGGGVIGSVQALVTMPNDDVIAGGYDISRWDGNAWGPLGAGTNGVVFALTLLANGDLVAGGQFTTAGGAGANNIARWNGVTWQPLGAGLNGRVNVLTTLANGDVIAGGWFTTAGGIGASQIARWDGTSWSPLGAGVDDSVNALACLPNGDLIAAGSFDSAGGVAASSIARWNGATWSQLDSGLGVLAGLGNIVLALAVLHNGELAVAGEFATANGVVSAYFARYVSTCPASAVAFGASCSGAAGPLVMVPTTMPWIGSTFRYGCSGITPGSFALQVFGFATIATPLVSLHSAGVTGCDLLASPDSLVMLQPSAGLVTGQVHVPESMALVGGALHGQVLLIELGPGANITNIAGSNGLTVTIGAF